MTDRERDGYVLTTDPAEVDVDTVHRWLSEQAYWALGRPREVVEATLQASRVWSVHGPDGAQAAFARAVTDGATFAWICDVFVDGAHRGHGLGTWLSGEIVADLRADGVERLVLATSSAHAVYRRVGFEDVEDGRYMVLDARSDAVRAAIEAAAAAP